MSFSKHAIGHPEILDVNFAKPFNETLTRELSLSDSAVFLRMGFVCSNTGDFLRSFHCSFSHRIHPRQ